MAKYRYERDGGNKKGNDTEKYNIEDLHKPSNSGGSEGPVNVSGTTEDSSGGSNTPHSPKQNSGGSGSSSSNSNRPPSQNKDAGNETKKQPEAPKDDSKPPADNNVDDKSPSQEEIPNEAPERSDDSSNNSSSGDTSDQSGLDDSDNSDNNTQANDSSNNSDDVGKEDNSKDDSDLSNDTQDNAQDNDSEESNADDSSDDNDESEDNDEASSDENDDDLSDADDDFYKDADSENNSEDDASDSEDALSEDSEHSDDESDEDSDDDSDDDNDLSDADDDFYKDNEDDDSDEDSEDKDKDSDDDEEEDDNNEDKDDKNDDSSDDEKDSDDSDKDKDNKDDDKDSEDKDNEDSGLDKGNDQREDSDKPKTDDSGDGGGGIPTSKEELFDAGMKKAGLGDYKDIAKGIKDKNVRKAAMSSAKAGIKSAASKGIISLAGTILGATWPILLAILLVVVQLVLMSSASAMFLHLLRGEGIQSEEGAGCAVAETSDTELAISTDADQEEVAELVWDYAIGKHGATKKAAAGLLGNFQIESGVSPASIQSGQSFDRDKAMNGSVKGYAMGLAQWDGVRRPLMIKYVEDKSDKDTWKDAYHQMEFAFNEEQADSAVLKGIMTDKSLSIEEATTKLVTDWERAGVPATDERVSAANQWYKKLEGRSVSSNLSQSTDSSSDSEGASESCEGDDDVVDGELGKSVKANGKTGAFLEHWKNYDDIPSKYKKHIQLPKVKKESFEGSPFVPQFQAECTELTWAYMSQIWGKTQPSSGHGKEIYKAYKAGGAKTTKNPTVGYGFSSEVGYLGAGSADVGHTAVVIGVLDDGTFLAAHFNLDGEGKYSGYKKSGERRVHYVLHDGAPGDSNATFFSGVAGSKPQVKNKED